MGGTSPPYSQRRYFEFRIFTTCKRILGQSNIFAPVCHSVHRGVLSQHALQVVSQHALQQVSGGGLWYPSMPCRFPGPHPRGKLRGIRPGGSPGPHPRGKSRGSGLGGVSRPTPKGEVEGDLAGVSPDPHLGGVSRPTPGGCVQAHT